MAQLRHNAAGTLWEASGSERAVAPIAVRSTMSQSEVNAEFAVLASSSSGNCSVLITGTGRRRRVLLIDCGISPRRTRAALADLGLRFDAIDDILLTHLDRDHCHPGWIRALPTHARFRIHRQHLRRAEREGILIRKTAVFDASPFSLASGVQVQSCLASHDAHGVAVFRMQVGDATLGFATDLGRVTPTIIEHLAHVDVLAIESNYCPTMQVASDRPAFLKDRIMGGSGHLSNEEAAHAVLAIEPRQRVVLLHLSQQCNTPERAIEVHAHCSCPIETAHADVPTALIRLNPLPNH